MDLILFKESDSDVLCCVEIQNRERRVDRLIPLHCETIGKKLEVKAEKAKGELAALTMKVRHRKSALLY